MKKTLILIATWGALLTSCQSNTDRSAVQKTLADQQRQDLENKTAKRKSDSTTIATLKARKQVNISDKTILVLEKAKTTNKLRLEIEETEYNTWYKSRLAERGNTFLTLKIKFSSKSKPGADPGDFFPSLDVFTIDKANNSITFLGKMDYNLYRKSNLNFVYLEQIFDYQESETFICSKEIAKPTKKLAICVNQSENHTFDKENVIAIL